MITIMFTPGDVLAVLAWYLLFTFLAPFVKSFGKGIFDAIRSRRAWRRHLRDTRGNGSER